MTSPATECGLVSFARGPEAVVWEKTIGQALRETRQRSATRDALIDRQQNLRYSWDQLIVECERIAAGLFALGIQPGDRVGIWSTNCAEWVMLQYACGLSGIILVNVNPAYRAHELRYVLDRSRIRVLFLHERDQRANYREILNRSIEGVDCALERAIYLGTRDWQAMLDAGEPYVQPVVMPNDVANIQYTSGTTGSPKGVLLTHRNLINDGRFIAERLRYTDQDRICLPVPLYHCFGCTIGTMSAAASGATIILPAPTFDAKLTLEAIHQERATSVYGVPTMFIAELSHPDFATYDCTSLRTGVMAGSPCPIEVMRRVVNEMHMPEITICYGQTECAPVNVMSSTDDALELRCSTVGRTMPATEIRIANPNNNETVARGEVGELRCKGFGVMKGYDADPKSTAEVFDPDGWLCSGDLAVMREDGYIRITGRLKDMILRGGENIYPREIEEFLYTHPKVADVQVIGIPDKRLGEVVSAWIVLKPGQTADEAEIKGFCQGQIAYFKIPAYVRFVDAFPLTVTGKVQKFRMREIEIEERGLADAAATETA